MKTLAMLMPVRAMAQKAIEFTQYTKGRWDVPTGDWVPTDLRDTSPVLPYTADRKLTSGMLLMPDSRDRSEFSPAVLIAASLMPLAVLIMAFGPLMPQAILRASVLSTSTIGLLLAGFAAWVMARNRMPLGTVAKAVALGFVVPLIGLTVSSGALSALGPIGVNIGNTAQSLLRLVGGGGLVGGLLAVMFLLWLISFFTPYAKRPKAILYRIVVAIALLAVVINVAPACAFLLTILYASYAPRSIYNGWDRQRARWLAARGTKFGGQTLGHNLDAHIEVRVQQAKKAAADDKENPNLIYCGMATGKLNQRLDPFAPDAGGKLMMNKSDTATHFLVVGETGAGKTDSIVKPYVTQWMIGGMGGCCIYDGKSDLALQFAGIPGFTVITPPIWDTKTGEKVSDGVTIGLVENCIPGLVTETLAAVLGNANKQQAQKDNDEYFKNQAMNLGKHAEQFCYWLAQTDHHVMAKGWVPKDYTRTWLWSAYDIRRAIKLLAKTDGILDGDTRERPVDQWIERLRQFCPVPVEHNPMLQEAIDYILEDIPAMAKRDKEWGGIVSSAILYYDKLMQNRSIREWSRTEKGDTNVNACLHGAWMGVYLPLSFGESGLLAQALIRLQQTTEGRSRGNNWRQEDPTATDCLFVLDEAQRILTPKDEETLSLGRSQGIRMLCATQSISAFVERFGEVGVQVMATNFLSWCLMRSNAESFQFLGAKLGKTFRTRGSDVAAAKPDDFITQTVSLNNPTNDWEAAFGGETMELLAAQGYGMAVPSQIETHNGRLVDDYAETMDAFARNEMFIAEASVGKAEHLDLVEEADFHALAKGQGYALMSVRRGGVDRRDFVRLQAMKTIDPAWFTKAA